MDETTFKKISKKLPPVKTGRRFGAKFTKTKKVGLFSERRFLIFTKRGPLEITFKPIHYTAAFLTLIVGFSSIVYWSFLGLSSAIDVAQKDLITEASANFVFKKNHPEALDMKTDTSISEIIENTEKNVDGKFQSNITIPTIKNNDFKSFSEKQFFEKKIIKDKIFQDEIFKSKIINDNKEKKDIFDEFVSFAPEDYLLKDKEENKLKNNLLKSTDEFDDTNDHSKNLNVLLPPKLDQRAENYRFVASLDNELKIMEKVFTTLNLKIKNSKIISVSELDKNQPSTDPKSDEYLFKLKQRLKLLSIYKDAIQFIPLKPPMEHYYVSSNYGKRKHPVTKKWRFHHGIDLAGTWQENVTVSADGVVIFAGYHGSFGKVIRIKHNFGIMTTYGHLAKIKVKKGEIVTEGQVVGKMGKTGRVDGAHLHYEISVNGKSQNPSKFFKIGRSLLSRNSIRSFAELK